ncbi:MAG TPA: hypothetical protein VKT81_06880 [Bryobacteraceae bacterium]|nr:hypothetical protein [Bryobacteraceae bacterium]
MASVPSTNSGLVTVRIRLDAEWRHHARLYLTWFVMAILIAAVAYFGFPYYRMGQLERAYSPLRPLFRPSGTVGLRLGIFGLVLFLLLFLYPIRKRWPWLGRIGKTKHWLDFHVLLGITAPIIITMHSAFRLAGLAGVAYWIMMAVALSGFIGRYLFAQIPRSLSSAELSFKEMQSESTQLAEQLERQAVLRPEEVAPLLKLPAPEDVEKLSILAALWMMARLDIARPFQVSRLRRRSLSGARIFLTLGGLLPSRQRDLEAVIKAIRKQSWLSTKMLFLKRVHEVFHLWHVIHRPFSYSFAVLVVAHITVAMLLGYY